MRVITANFMISTVGPHLLIRSEINLTTPRHIIRTVCINFCKAPLIPIFIISTHVFDLMSQSYCSCFLKTIYIIQIILLYIIACATNYSDIPTESKDIHMFVIRNRYRWQLWLLEMVRVVFAKCRSTKNLVRAGLKLVSNSSYTLWCHQMETFTALLALCAGNSPVTGNSPHNGQWRGALMFSLICAWIHSWVNKEYCMILFDMAVEVWA